jgi:hypothetical protein
MMNMKKIGACLTSLTLLGCGEGLVPTESLDWRAEQTLSRAVASAEIDLTTAKITSGAPVTNVRDEFRRQHPEFVVTDIHSKSLSRSYFGEHAYYALDIEAR